MTRIGSARKDLDQEGWLRSAPLFFDHIDHNQVWLRLIVGSAFELDPVALHALLGCAHGFHELPLASQEHLPHVGLADPQQLRDDALLDFA